MSLHRIGLFAALAFLLSLDVAGAQDLGPATQVQRPAALTLPDAAKSAARTSFEQSFRTSTLARPKAQEMNRRFPGLVDAMATAAGAEFAVSLDRVFLELRPRVEALLRENLNQGEVEAAVSFYDTPAGRHITAMIPSMAEGGDFSNLPEDELRALMRFNGSPAGRKLVVLQSDIVVMARKSMEGAIAEAAPRMEAAVAEVGRTYTAKRRR